MPRRSNPNIEEFILQHVSGNSSTITSLVVRQFGITRSSVARYMSRLVEKKLIDVSGNTRGRTYHLKEIVEERFQFERTGRWTEDTIWRQNIYPLLAKYKPNVVDLCQYGVTEMINNVLDHSQSPTLHVLYKANYARIKIGIVDFGVGIFNKIKTDFNLEDARTALLELSKGKLTSDKRNHSGEGIYFTSRMFESFSILSGHLYFSRKRQEDDGWLIESRDEHEENEGTYVSLTIPVNADWTMRSVFDKYQGDDIYFRKTHIPIALGRYPGEQLVSRSQAKRILARAKSFSEVMLDFAGVGEIGQAFADEVFRVFKNQNPEIHLHVLNTNRNINKMIKYVTPQNEIQDDLF